jgi:serine/threonine-protein kinase
MVPNRRDQITAQTLTAPLRLGLEGSVPALDRGDMIAGRYEVEGLAGEGGMAVVYSARHLHLNERFAVKVLRPALATNPNVVSRFLQEARAAAQLRSDFVCRVFDVGLLHDGVPYMVMELLEGEDLGAMLLRTGTLGVDQAVEFVIQACEALAEAHAAGLVHRDIKPENLFLTVRRDGWATVKLLDFGISKIIDAETISTTLRRHVDTRDLLGTPHYMAPETVRSSREAGPRSDLWSMGVVLYELLSGRLPFKGATVPEVSAAILETDPEVLSSLRADLPPALVEIVHWCLAKQPELRVTSAAELALQLLPFAPRRSRAVVERMQSLARAQGELFDLPQSAFPPPLPGVPPMPPVPELPTSVMAPVENSVTMPAEEAPRRSTAAWWLLSAAAAFAIGGTITWMTIRTETEPSASPSAASTIAPSAATPEVPEPRETETPPNAPPPSVPAEQADTSTKPPPAPRQQPARGGPLPRPGKPAEKPAGKPDTAATNWQTGPDMGF